MRSRTLDYQQVIIPDAKDVRYVTAAIANKTSGLIGRVFNNAHPSTIIKTIICNFCKKYVANTTFQFKLDEFLQATNIGKTKLQPIYDENGNFQPSIKKFIPGALQNRLKKFLDCLHKLASELIIDKNGKLCDWVYDYLGQENIQTALKLFPQEMVQEQLVSAVMQCLAGEFSSMTSSNPNESNFRLIVMNIVTHQSFLNSQCQTEYQKLLSTIDQKKQSCPAGILNHALKVAQEGKVILTQLTKKPHQNSTILLNGLVAARGVVENHLDKNASSILKKVARETPSKPVLWKKFSGALLFLAGAALTFAHCYLPGIALFTSGVTLFYQAHKKKGFSKALYNLHNSTNRIPR